MDGGWVTEATTMPVEGARKLACCIVEADAVLIGAGAGLTAACGPEFAYSSDRYVTWRNAHATGKTLYLELGVGDDATAIIRHPFWHMVANNAQATYVQISQGDLVAPAHIAARTTLVNADIAQIVNAALVKMR